MNKKDFNSNDVNWTKDEEELIDVKVLGEVKKVIKTTVLSLVSIWCAAVGATSFYFQKSEAASKEALVNNDSDAHVFNKELYPDTQTYERAIASEEKWKNEVRASVASHKNKAQWAMCISGLFALAGAGGLYVGLNSYKSREEKVYWDVYQQRFQGRAKEG